LSGKKFDMPVDPITETDAVSRILGRATALLDGIEQIVNRVCTDEMVRDRMIACDVERRAAESLVESHFMPKFRAAVAEDRMKDAFEIFAAMPTCVTKMSASDFLRESGWVCSGDTWVRPAEEES
jgi:hypothetical protein